MKPVESVLVTIHAGEKAVDMELPAFVAIGEVTKKVEETLRAMDLGAFFGMRIRCLCCEGAELDSTKFLANYGVWDGSTLECVIERGSVR